MEKSRLELRKRMKRKKPDFVRQDSHKKGEIKPRWRRPRGMHSKMRLKKKGYRKMPNAGYRSPKDVRGLDISGLVPVFITSLKQLDAVAKDTQGIMISSSLGNKKRLGALKAAKEKGIKVLNIKNPDNCINKIEENMAKRKEKKKKKTEKKAEKKEAKKEEKPKAEKKKEGLKEMVGEEEKKMKEKKEKDKALIKKELQ